MELYKLKSVSEPTETDFAKGDVESFAHSSTSCKKTFDNLIISQTHKKSSKKCKNYTTNLFSVIKNQLDVAVVIEYYGITVNTKDFAICPFHQEKTPSFKINRENNTFHCFGCGEHGTVIDLVMKYYRLSNIEAVRKLNQDFELNLISEGEPVRATNCRLIQEDKNLISDFEKWEKRAFLILREYRYKLKRETADIIFKEECPELYNHLEKLTELSYIDYLLDLMIEDIHDFFEQVEFYRTFGGVVSKIEHRLNQ